MKTPSCHDVEERLPLLSYGELDASERNLVLVHLDGCASCRVANAALAASTAALSSLPLRHPDARRVEGLKAAVLEAVGAAGCPREVDLLDPGADGVGPTLEAHLAGCAPCREARAAFDQVSRALDLVPLTRPALGAADVRAGVLSRVGLAPAPGAAPVKAGRVVRFPGRRLAVAAAAVLVAAGAFTLGRVTAPSDPHQLAALKQSADVLVRSSRPQQRGWVAPAITAYTQVVEAGGHDDASARQARREVEALRALERLQHRADSPEPDDLEALMVEFPDASSTFECALAGYHVAGRGEVQAPITDGGAPAGHREEVSPWRARRGTIPYDDSAFAEALKVINKPALRQAILLQQGIRCEDLGELAQARGYYEQVLALQPGTPAARIADERLKRL